MKRVVLLISMLLASPLHATPSAWRQAQTKGMQMITGPFVQRDYGFNVKAPPEASAYVIAGISGDHGVRMILGEHREIDVYPEYTEEDWGNTQPCARNRFPEENASTRTEEAVRLGNQSACIVTFASRDTVRIVIQAARNDFGQDIGIMYTLWLTTTREALQTDIASLHRVAASFKRLPIRW